MEVLSEKLIEIKTTKFKKFNFRVKTLNISILKTPPISINLSLAHKTKQNTRKYFEKSEHQNFYAKSFYTKTMRDNRTKVKLNLKRVSL